MKAESNRRQLTGDRLAAFVSFGLAAYLAFVAYGLLAGAQPTTGGDPGTLRERLREASGWLVAGWCLASVPGAIGQLRGSTWGHYWTAILNALYLVPSVIGQAYFGITMHGALAAYAAVRLIEGRGR